MRNNHRRTSKIALPLGQRIQVNLERIANLLQLYSFMEISRKSLPDDKKYLTIDGSDILRSVVVLAHATLEDYLRSLIKLSWLEKDDDFIKEKLSNIKGRFGEKVFTIEDLINKKNKTIKAFFEEYLLGYIDNHLTFNDETQIVNYLKQCNAFNQKCKDCLKDIAEMTKRRHKIVHHADKSGTDKKTFSRISPSEVTRWVDSLSVLIFESLQEHVKNLGKHE